MRRKLVAVMLAVMVVSTSLAGCGENNTDQKESKKAQTTTVDKKSTDTKDESKEEVKEDKNVASEITKGEKTSEKNDSAKEESKKDESKKEESKKSDSKESSSKKSASTTETSKKDTSAKTTTASKTTSSSSNSNKKQKTTKPSTSTTKPSTSKPSSSTSTESTGSNKGNSSQTETKPAHQHNYVAQTHTVHHDATGHNEQYVVQDAYDEQVTTYEDYPWDCCNVCGADCTADPGGHAYQHAIKGEGGGHHTEYDSRPVTKTVHHDAVYGTKWVQDSAAYDETVVDGYVCSCGARK